MKLNGEVVDHRDTVKYVGTVEIAKSILAGRERSSFRRAVKGELKRLMYEMEAAALADWDEVHADPLDDLILALMHHQR